MRGLKEDPMLCTPRACRPALYIIAGLLLGAATPALAEEGPDPTVTNNGKADFEWQCTPCHGADGTGGGPMAKQLIKPPSNLTVIAKNNNGKYPFWRVYSIIAGKTEVPGHETFQMPEFWKRFAGAEYDFGFLPAHVRVLMLTHYLETIQEE
jgi:mono/diheme cytochrome c family protein